MFWVAFSVVFRKYSGVFISKLHTQNITEINTKIKVLIFIYIVLWVGSIIHYYIIQGVLLKYTRSFFFKRLFNPIWENIEKGNFKNVSTAVIIKKIWTLVVTSTSIVQWLIFVIIPCFFSVLFFLYLTPRIWSIQFVIILTVIIVCYIFYKYSKTVKDISADRVRQTNVILNLIEDNINNNLTILNFESFKKEYDEFLLNCNLQETECYRTGENLVYLSTYCLGIIIVGFLIPIYIAYKKLDFEGYKGFLISYIPMVISMIVVFYSNLSRIIKFLQTYGEQRQILDDLNSYFINDQKSNTKHDLNYKTKHSYLELHNVYLAFNNNIVFNSLNITFKPGITLIKGPIGTGKSCILKMIYGILHYQGGNIYYENKSKHHMDIREWRKKIFYINQFPSFFTSKKIESNIYYGSCPDATCNITSINKIIDEFNLSQKVDYLKLNEINSSHLSGGEKQIISIIRAIAYTDKVIFLIDEPTASLDATMRLTLYKLIKLLKNTNKIVLIVSHDGEFANIADKIIDISKYNNNLNIPSTINKLTSETKTKII